MTQLWIVIFMTALSGIGGTGIGGLIGALVRSNSNKAVSLLLSFAAGVMLAVVGFDLIPEAIYPAHAQAPTSLFLVMAGVIVGFAVIYLLNYLIDRRTNKEVAHVHTKGHPHTADDLDELIHSDHFKVHKEKHNRYQLFIGGLVMAIAIALHNLPEGMVIGSSYAVDTISEMTVGAGFLMAIVIGLHNIPEGMAVSVPLIAGGMKKIRAVVITALAGAPTMIGAAIGYGVGMISPLMLSLSLSFASGAMLYVVLGELVPESFLMWKSKMPACGIFVGILVGMLIVYI